MTSSQSRLINLHLIAGQIYVWHADEVELLRKEHHIVGSLVGSLPGTPRQNAQLGLPLQLMPEEAAMLRDQGLAKLVAVSIAKPCGQAVRDFTQSRMQSISDQKLLWQQQQADRREMLRDVIEEGRLRKKRKQQGANQSSESDGQQAALLQRTGAVGETSDKQQNHGAERNSPDMEQKRVVETQDAHWCDGSKNTAINTEGVESKFVSGILKSEMDVEEEPSDVATRDEMQHAKTDMNRGACTEEKKHLTRNQERKEIEASAKGAGSQTAEDGRGSANATTCISNECSRESSAGPSIGLKRHAAGDGDGVVEEVGLQEGQGREGETGARGIGSRGEGMACLLRHGAAAGGNDGGKDGGMNGGKDGEKDGGGVTSGVKDGGTDGGKDGETVTGGIGSRGEGTACLLRHGAAAGEDDGGKDGEKDGGTNGGTDGEKDRGGVTSGVKDGGTDGGKDGEKAGGKDGGMDGGNAREKDGDRKAVHTDEGQGQGAQTAVEEEVKESGCSVQLFTAEPPKSNFILKAPPRAWHYPSNEKEELRYRVFQHFWEMGYYLTSGTKFGGDFLVYPGDPLLFHSYFIVVCLPHCGQLSPVELISHGRLGTFVKKTVVLCSVDSSKRVVSTSLQWSGIS